ncbi:uncharacterized protein LOC142221262 isoform X2 [Haematobia irritans]
MPSFQVVIKLKESPASTAKSSTSESTESLTSDINDDLNWTTIPNTTSIRRLPAISPILKKYALGNSLENRDRVKIAKAIIDECLKDNPGKIINKVDFHSLAESIISIFPTEVVSAYYIPSIKGCIARGKLWSCYNNKRTLLSLQGQIVRRGKTASKRKGHPLPDTDELVDSIEFLEKNSSDWALVLCKWSETHKFRMEELQSSISTHDYIKKYAGLSDERGVELVAIDVGIMHPSHKQADNWILIYKEIVKRARSLRDNHSLKLLSDIDEASNERYKAQLSLLLVPYILPHSGKRSESSGRNATKNEIQMRFIKEYKSLTDLKEDPEASDLQIKFIRNKNELIYADFSIAGYVYKTCDILEALNTAFMFLMGINVSYPRICVHVWQFIQLAIFKIPLPEAKVPHVESLVNDLRI